LDFFLDEADTTLFVSACLASNSFYSLSRFIV
jgi:hypothetical protein